MKRTTLRLLFVAWSASLLFACETASTLDSATLIQLDQKWIALYQKRLEAVQGNTSAAMIDADLEQLSEDAEKRGNEASAANDPATAAGFYRIAATSAWTSGRLRNDALLALRDKGNEVCAKVAADPSAQPRDCAFIRLAPDLAALDQSAAEAKSIATLDGANLARATNVVDAMTKSIERVLRDRPTPGVQSKSFDDYIAVNLNAAWCTIQGLVGRPSNSSAAALESLVAKGRTARDALRAQSISTQCRIG